MRVTRAWKGLIPGLALGMVVTVAASRARDPIAS